MRQKFKVAFGTFRDRPVVLVRIVDTDGVEGWGEAWCNWPAVGAEHRARLAVDIGERRSGGMAIAGTDARRFRDILEAPAAEVAIEGAAPLGAREKDIHATIAVNVAERHAGALTEDSIPQQQGIADGILEVDSGGRLLHVREAGLAGGNVELPPAIARLLVPWWCRTISTCRAKNARAQRDEGKSTPCVAPRIHEPRRALTDA